MLVMLGTETRTSAVVAESASWTYGPAMKIDSAFIKIFRGINPLYENGTSHRWSFCMLEALGDHFSLSLL